MDTEAQPRGFLPTRWSIVIAAQGPPTADSRTALDRLVRAYWGPVYWTIRRGWSRSSEDAKDLTQEFFVRLLERGGVDGFEPEKGRFRSFLCAAVKHFMLQTRRDGARLKRGGGKLPFSLDHLRDEGVEPIGKDVLPEDVFHQEWVRAVFQDAVAGLEEECRAAGRGVVFEVFTRYELVEENRPTHEDLAQALAIGVHDVNNHLRYARRRLREILRDHIRETLSDPGDLDDEVCRLFGA